LEVGVDGLITASGDETRRALARAPLSTGPLLVALAHFVIALVNIELTAWSVGMATVWAANAIVLAALLATPSARWLPYVVAVWVAGFLANLIGGYPIIASAPFAAINVAEAALAATLTRQWVGGAPELERPLDLVKFVVSAIVASALSASLSAPFMAYATDHDIGRSWLSWFASDTLGLLVVTPVLFIAFAMWMAKRSFLQGRSVAEATALFAMVAGLSLAVFAQDRWPLLFLLLPPVVLTTFRLRSAGATVAIVIIAVIGSYFSTRSSGPIALMEGDLADRIYFFQFFLAATFLPALPVASVLDERDALAAIAERQAATDELTGTASRRAFLARLDGAAEAARIDGRPLAVALFDVDHFKAINDRHGHDVGDEVLRRVGGLALGVVRHDGLVGRLGGEEFAIIMPDTSLAEALAVCERLCTACRALGIEAGASVTISVGVAVADPGATPRDVLKAADEAMYRAKRNGRNRVVAVDQTAILDFRDQ
jgi:diguanylate cyclase (GGDEF)-like protein